MDEHTKPTTPPCRKRRGTGKTIQVIMSPALYAEIESNARENRRSLSESARILLYQGLKLHQLHDRYCIRTRKQRDEVWAQLETYAEQFKTAAEARKQSRKKGKKQKAQAPAILLIDGVDGE